MFGKFKSSAGPVDYMIVGLGNPGKQYENSRHNAGFITLDTLAEKHGCKLNKIKFKSYTGACTINGVKVMLMKPTTYMNNSGQAVTEAMNFYKLPPENVIIIFDDISLNVGNLRIKRKGSDGGQNGMKNIIYLSGHDTFPRIKIGIGAKPNPNWELADWVLSKFTKEERKAIGQVAENACDALEYMVKGDFDTPMNKYN